MKPIYKPKKELSKGHKDLMKEHKSHHTKKHLDMMVQLMKEGYCFPQPHTLGVKKIGK